MSAYVCPDCASPIVAPGLGPVTCTVCERLVRPVDVAAGDRAHDAVAERAAAHPQGLAGVLADDAAKRGAS